MSDAKTLSAAIIGAALVSGAVVLGIFYHSAQTASGQNDVLTVTGSTRTAVVSDQAKLIVSITRTANLSSLAAGYAGIARDLKLVNDLVKKENIPDEKIVAGPVSMSQLYDQNGGENIRYQLFQTVTVQDNDVSKITKLSQLIPSLASGGAIVSVQSLEYYYSRLADLRVSLLSEAVKDAKARAEKIAEGTGRQVGNIQSANNGVVQVLAPNSVDISDYGSYDTSSVQKDIMVTVKASFRLK
jgi:hypothetical protein